MEDELQVQPHQLKGRIRTTGHATEFDVKSNPFERC